MKTHPEATRPACLKPAFTLTEMLVTIVIIIVLAVFSFSGLTRMRQSGDRIGATRSLSQIQLANAGYAADHNGQYVPVYAFDDTGAKYVAWQNSPKYLSYLKGEEAVYKSNGAVDNTLPLNLLDPIAVRAKQLNYQAIAASFGYMTNGMPGAGWGKPNSTPSYKISQLTSPERTAAFVTATDWNVNYTNRFKWETARTEGFFPGQRMSYRHNGKALVAYYDGHVGEVSVADVRKIDTQGGSSNIFWKGDAK
jgi:prepilin-type processing-associated H-X9-DG protein